MVVGKGCYVVKFYVVLVSVYDHGIGFGFVERSNMRDILGSIGDIAALTIVGGLLLTVGLTGLFTISFTLVGIAMLMHSVDGDANILAGKGSNVIGASFGE